MKLIHCADLHLDAKMSANLDKEKAKERKAEMLYTFERMVAYAAEQNVRGILIAGDMFDTGRITATTKNAVLHQIKNHPQILFYYLNGNHDSDNFLASLEDVPENLKLFGTAWTEHSIGNVVITGVDLTAENADLSYASLELQPDKFNIVMLHGQEGELIQLRSLKNKGIDYLALGHIHGYKEGELDPRGTYCYPGCLEGRGFDECGEHGFVLLDIEEETGAYSHTFVPFAKRRLYEVSADVTDCQTTAEMISKVDEALVQAACEETALVKIVLMGELDVACEKDVDYMLARFKSRYYFVKISDETTLKMEAKDYQYDESLKGEYVRMVMGDHTLSEEDKKLMIRYGLQVIAGEEVQ